MPDNSNADDLASKRSRRKLLMDTASKIVDMIEAVADKHQDIHYIIGVVGATLNHEDPCEMGMEPADPDDDDD